MIAIGQRVRVRRLRDRVSEDIVKKLGQIGIVESFKMVDGSGVGAQVKFADASMTWFFEDELEVIG